MPLRGIRSCVTACTDKFFRHVHAALGRSCSLRMCCLSRMMRHAPSCGEAHVLIFASLHVRDMHRPTAVWTRHPHALARMRFHAPSRGMAPLRSRIGPVSKSRDLGRESGRASPAIPHGNFCRRRSECHTTIILGGNDLRRKVFM